MSLHHIHFFPFVSHDTFEPNSILLTRLLAVLWMAPDSGTYYVYSRINLCIHLRLIMYFIRFFVVFAVVLCCARLRSVPMLLQRLMCQDAHRPSIQHSKPVSSLLSHFTRTKHILLKLSSPLCLPPSLVSFVFHLLFSSSRIYLIISKLFLFVLFVSTRRCFSTVSVFLPFIVCSLQMVNVCFG